VCLSSTHRDTLNVGEILRLGRREEREAQGGARHRVRGHRLLKRGGLLDILEHPNADRYAGQRIFVVRREEYVYLVPFVEDEHTVFLKTIIPSRKATKQYLGEESDDEDGR
jgi:hypothetical protein